METSDHIRIMVGWRFRSCPQLLDSSSSSSSQAYFSGTAQTWPQTLSGFDRLAVHLDID